MRGDRIEKRRDDVVSEALIDDGIGNKRVVERRTDEQYGPSGRNALFLQCPDANQLLRAGTVAPSQQHMHTRELRGMNRIQDSGIHEDIRGRTLNELRPQRLDVRTGGANFHINSRHQVSWRLRARMSRGKLS